MNLGDYKTELGSLLHDPGNDEFSPADITRWINRAQLYVGIKTGCLQRIYSTSGVANQAEYTWPTYALKILGVMYDWDKPLYPTSKKDLEHYDEDWIQANAVTDPTHYYLVEVSRKLGLYPPPSSAADTTAINNAGGITNSATTIPVDSTSGFPSRGRILIESEIISYTNTTSTTFTGCGRGAEDTTAAAHVDNTAVTLRDIAIWSIQKPTDLSADTDEPWRGLSYLSPYHGALLPYCLYMARMKNGQPTEAREYWRQFLIELDDMKKELAKLQPERTFQYVEQKPAAWPKGFGYKWPIEVAP